MDIAKELAMQYVILNGRPDPTMRDGIYVRSEVHNRIVAAHEARCREEENKVERAFSVLSANGVPPARAKSIANGIDVLSTRYRREILDLTAALAASREREKKLLDLARHYNEGPFKPSVWLICKVVSKEIRSILAEHGEGEEKT